LLFKPDIVGEESDAFGFFEGKSFEVGAVEMSFGFETISRHF
jgi:hypothetical protein